MLNPTNHLENFHLKLSHYTMIPLLGTIPALIKVIAGLVEAVVSVALAILLILPSLCSDDAKLLLKSCGVHILQGTKRMAVGLFLSIPLVGTVTVPCIYGTGCLSAFSLGYFQGALGAGFQHGVDTGVNTATTHYDSLARTILG